MHIDPPSPPPSPTATLGPLRRRQADGWSLVLSSEGIGHQLLPASDGVYLAVDAADAGRASASLAAYLAENETPKFDTAVHPPSPPPSPTHGALPAGRSEVGLGVAAGAALLASFAVTGDATHGGGLAAIGAANSGLILDGAVWRTVTALTLHAGLGHVLANALATVIFLPLAARRLGFGLAILGTLLAGAAGNTLTAFVRGPGSSGVGFSTAVFGTVGLLAGARLVDGGRRGRGGCWIVIGAALALLALLGAGEQTDVLAHACGLAAGVPFGAAFVRVGRNRRSVDAGAAVDGARRGSWLQWGAAAAAMALIAGAWVLAVR